MTERGLIISRIRKKEAEIQQLEDKLRAARGYVQALKDVLTMLSSDDNVIVSDLPRETSASPFRAGTAMAQARQAIIEHGKPMHLDDILRAVGKEPTRESRTSLGSALSAHVRKSEVFTRPAVSTFGLVELQHFSYEESNYLDEPPPGFGSSGNGAAPVIEHDD